MQVWSLRAIKEARGKVKGLTSLPILTDHGQLRLS
jgi:hypothetical protein